MQISGQLLEDRCVLTDQAEEGRAPRADGDGVDEHKSSIACAMKEQGPQRDRPAEVMCDHGRYVQLPVREQLGEHPTLHVERYVLTIEALGRAVARHVPDKHFVVPGEGTG